MQHPGLWFEDGDLVLVANTACAQPISFLIHRCTFCKSPVFRRILLTNDFNFHPIYKDAIVWEVTDPAADVAVLLQCLYYDLPFNHAEPTVTVDLGGLLRLCKKYEFAEITARIIAQLKHEWPTSLAIWDIHETRIRTLSIAHAGAPDGQIDAQYLDNRLPEPASIIALAREFALPELFPAAFYALALVSSSANYDAFHADFLPESERQQLANGTRSARWPLLTPPDLLRLAKGHDRMRSQKSLTRALASSQRPQTKDCAAGCTSLLTALRELGDHTHDILGALTYLRLYISEPGQASRMKICAGCAKALCDASAALRLQIWRSLPEWFDLTGVELTA
ncbi:hypothetical protein C8F04DRAFT_964614 [Mycena alexandri]|uniref:BTB domain-containing protein n=1 Tax=Mycena alexandri TaxID=1745969 RepID=A0AAD6SI44_9AGAR|nr:hypothetical protein C8F04DRAFT_964614 [Mycena alexandri]